MKVQDAHRYLHAPIAPHKELLGTADFDSNITRALSGSRGRYFYFRQVSSVPFALLRENWLYCELRRYSPIKPVLISERPFAETVDRC